MPFDLGSYELVEHRLARFWKDHPEGRILTDLVEHSDGQYVVKASVWRVPLSDPSSVPDATGYAEERETERGVNATSALENCETSAIGRALANLGYAPKGKRPSREEMTKTSRRAAGKPAAAEAPKSYGEGDDGSTAAAGTTSAGEQASSVPPDSDSPSPSPASSSGSEAPLSPDEQAGPVASPPRPAGACLHLDGTRTITNARGNPVDVCVDCGRPV